MARLPKLRSVAEGCNFPICQKTCFKGRPLWNVLKKGGRIFREYNFPFFLPPGEWRVRLSVNSMELGESEVLLVILRYVTYQLLAKNVVVVNICASFLFCIY